MSRGVPLTCVNKCTIGQSPSKLHTSATAISDQIVPCNLCEHQLTALIPRVYNICISQTNIRYILVIDTLELK